MKFSREPAILVCSHGSLCMGLIDTVSMVIGDMQEVDAMPLLRGADIDEYEKRVRQYVDSKDGNVILLLDVVGGSPYNTAMKLCRQRELCAIAGANFAMLASAVEARENYSEYEDADALAAAIEAEAKEAVRNVMPELKIMYQMAKTMSEQV